MVVDTHAHVYSNNYDDINLIVQNAINNNVCKIFNCGESIETSKEVLFIKEKYPSVFECTVGIHPLYANEVTKDDLEELENLIKTKNVIAIGEIGLDFHYENVDKELQKKLFIFQLDLATKYNLPVIIHVRKCTSEMVSILKNYNLKGIIHCFNGSYETAIEYKKLGYLLGIGGLVTFKNCNLINVLKRIDLNNIVFETDCPFLTPEPFRKYKNEPKYVTETMKFVAEKLGKKYEDLAYISNKNIERIFDIEV